jgi:hypothetical protein
LIATCAAINFDPRGKLRPGEKATVMCVACDRHQAAILFNYIRGYFETIPALKAMVTSFGGSGRLTGLHIAVWMPGMDGQLAA